MRIHFTHRTIAWFGAGLGIVLGAGAYLLASGSGAPSGQAESPSPNAQKMELEDRSKPVRVRVVRPTRERLQKTSTQAAYVDPYEEADLFAKTSGYLEVVHVDIGDGVRKGQLLAEIWIPEMEQERIHKEALVEKARAEQEQAQAAVKAGESLVDAAKAKASEARSQIARYEAEAKYRKVEYDRHLQLFNERALQRDIVDEKSNQLQAARAALEAAHATSDTAEANMLVEQAKLKQARADRAAAEAQVKVTQAELDLANVLLAYAKVTAPYDGVITKRLVHPGAFIQSASNGNGDPLFHLARFDRIRIVADVPEADSAWVKVGQPATFRVDALRGQQFQGKVARFSDALDGHTRTMRVEVALDGANTVLRPGMYGSVSITLADQDDALLVPTSVLVTGGGAPSVMIASNGRVERRTIEIGQNDGVRVHVIAGLSDTDQVIAEGKDAVRDGQQVEVVNR
ncbi:MAG: efflux RND transporter periplasmic adaptor subunit [Planctomycetia bacterium]|nr:efflux RND transporter periplasmic adaptor subunit [Planctomycetia bacterium]